jgi:ribosomal protein S2
MVLAITVPQNIPINITNQPTDNCITPKQHIEKSRTRRQRKSSPTINIPVIAIVDTNNENNCGNSPIPKPNIKEKLTNKRPSTRSVRRKILLDETEETKSTIVKEEQKPTRKRNTRSIKKSINSSSTS